MNSGMAVVLGALIALTGSALIPWLRDTLTQRRVRAENLRQRRDDALVEMVAKNDAFAMVWAGKDADARGAAMEERSRAGMRLLLTLEGTSVRTTFFHLINSSLPHVLGGTNEAASMAGAKLAAFQDVLVRWSANEIKSENVMTEYERRVAIFAKKQDG